MSSSGAYPVISQMDLLTAMTCPSLRDTRTPSRIAFIASSEIRSSGLAAALTACRGPEPGTGASCSSAIGSSSNPCM